MQNIQDVENTKKIKLSKTIENTGFVMVNEFVNGHSPPDKRVQLKRKVTTTEDSLHPPPLPANGVEYGMGEFLGIIQTYKRHSKRRGAMLTKMLSPEYSYVKRSRRTVYCIIAEHEKGRIFDFEEPWRDMGRPQIMNDDEVDLFTESVRKNPGEKNMRECVNDMCYLNLKSKLFLFADDTTLSFAHDSINLL